MSTCVLCPPRPLDKQRPLRDGGLTCWACHDTLGQTITEVGRRYLLLDATPSTGGDGGRRSPGFGSRPPVNLHVAALRDPRTLPVELGDPHNALSLLRSWANAIRSARGPVLHPCESFVPGDTKFGSWITRQPAVTLMAEEFRAVQSQLRSATGEPNPKPVGYCIKPTLTATGEFEDWCNGPLFPPRDGESDITCPQCEAVYEPLEQIKVKIQNEQDPEAGDPCAACRHTSSQHDNDAADPRPCNVRWCDCTAHVKQAA